MVQRLKWMFFERILLRKRIKGFKASRYSFADNKCKFGEFVKLHGKARLSDVKVGRFTYICDALIGNADIGSFCSIASNVVIGQGLHPTDLLSTSPLFYSNKGQLEISLCELQIEENKRTIIGNDVWIGYGVFIKDGVKIGNGAIIGAGAVVVKDVPEFTIVGGVPAKKIRNRFSDEQIRKIKEMNWYNWDLKELRDNIELFTKRTIN